MHSPHVAAGNAVLPSTVLQLPALERALLWSIRTWAAYYDAPQSVWWPLERVFAEAGIRPALEPFAQLMSALFAGLKRCPDIRCVRCPRMGRDESELLAILAVALHESPAALSVRLRHLMLPAAARTATGVVREMMRVVANAGLHLQQEHNDIAARQSSHSTTVRTATH
jgi:hypothetical protein